MSRLRKLRSNLFFNIISAIVLLIVLLSLIVSAIGYIKFTDTITQQYNDSAFNTAATAAALIKPDNIELYLESGGNNDEYRLTLERLDLLCNKQNVALIYVIYVDTSDYNSFVSVFNSVNENSGYTPWEIGLVRNTTNEQYREYYREIYEDGLERATVVRNVSTDSAEPHITSLIPLVGSDGEVKSILCVQRPMSGLRAGRQSYLILIAVTAAIMTALVVVISVLYIRENIVRPIRTVAAEAVRFAGENTRMENGSLGNISKINEIAALANSVEKMEDDTLSYIENLTAVTAEKHRIGTELQVASLIQKGALPAKFPAFPDREEFDIFASMTPAKEVGGDFYDFFFTDENHLALIMADVSGKGIPAALFMMVTKIILKERAIMGGTPEEVLSFVNKRIVSNNLAEMFVTLWLGILDVRTGVITAANAGHDDPAIYRKGGRFDILKSRHGLVIGAMEEAKYCDYEIRLNPGDKIFLYTDGVPEATDANEKLYTVDRMVKALNECREKNVNEILPYVTESVNNFVGGAAQFDDMTMLCLEYMGYEKKNVIDVEAVKENLETVTDFVDGFLESAECSLKVKMNIDLAVEEIFVNIANYAYGENTGMASIAVQMSESPRGITIVFTDGGKPYDPTARQLPDTTLSADEREIGGLGIFLTKKLMDDVSYEYKEGKNILTIKKNI